MTQAGRRSAFETWAYEREARAEQSVAANYVPAGTVGYQDLDSYGTWSNDPEYGNVWQPSTSYVFTDWAPYRYGRWIWVTPWGWTWVDDAPWGYAPFHYGRWTYLRQRWCWIPGPRHVHATYAPALVGVGGLAELRRAVPRRRLVPARARARSTSGAAAVRGVTSATSTTSTRGTRWTTLRCRMRTTAATRTFNYRNRGAPHAVTVIDHDAFVSGRRTHGQRVDVDENDLQALARAGRAPTIDPNAYSRLGCAANPTSTRASPRSSGDRNAPSAGNEATGFALTR